MRSEFSIIKFSSSISCCESKFSFISILDFIFKRIDKDNANRAESKIKTKVFFIFYPEVKLIFNEVKEITSLKTHATCWTNILRRDKRDVFYEQKILLAKFRLKRLFNDIGKALY